MILAKRSNEIVQMAEWYRASAFGSVDLGFGSESGQTNDFADPEAVAMTLLIVYGGFDYESGQTNDFKIGIHSFPA